VGGDTDENSMRMFCDRLWWGDIMGSSLWREITRARI